MSRVLLREMDNIVKKIVDEVSKSTGIPTKELLKKPNMEADPRRIHEITLYIKYIKELQQKISKSVYQNWIKKQSQTKKSRTEI